MKSIVIREGLTKAMHIFHLPQFSLCEVVIYGFFFLFFWISLLQFIRTYFPKRRIEYSLRHVSALHSVVSIVLGLIAICDEIDNPLWGKFGRQHITGLQQIAAINTISYFISDTFSMILFRCLETVYVGHHILAGFSLAAAIFFSRCAFEGVLALFILELSNPWMHYRWIYLDEYHVKSGSEIRNVPGPRYLWLFLNQGFTCTFIFARLFLGVSSLVGKWKSRLNYLKKGKKAHNLK